MKWEREFLRAGFRVKLFKIKFGGIEMEIIGKAKEWLFTIALKKGVKAAVVFIVGILAAKEVPGIEINPDAMTTYLTALAVSGLTMLLNYIKVKTGTKIL